MRSDARVWQIKVCECAVSLSVSYSQQGVSLIQEEPLFYHCHSDKLQFNLLPYGDASCFLALYQKAFVFLV